MLNKIFILASVMFVKTESKYLNIFPTDTI